MSQSQAAAIDGVRMGMVVRQMVAVPNGVDGSTQRSNVVNNGTCSSSACGIKHAYPGMQTTLFRH